MKNEYAFNFPVRVIFGRGKRALLHDELSLFNKKLLICGNHFKCSDVFRQLFGNRNDYIIHVCPGTEPTLAMVQDALDTARANKVDAVAAIGGGSVMDIGKSVAALLYQQEDIREYFYCRAEFKAPRVFFCALPTSAGTGAEVTPNSVLTDELNNIKQSLRGKACGVDLAIVDPELTYSCSPHVVQQSGMDSLTQAIEGAISNKANNVTFAWSMQAFKLVFDNLEKACQGDLNAKDAVSEGTMIGAMAFMYSGLGAVHGLAHPLGSLLHIPHGECCAILLLPILRRNSVDSPELFTELAQSCGFSSADALFDAIAVMQKKFGIPFNFKTYALSADDYPFIVNNCRSGSMKCNRKFYSDEEITGILQELS